jgi:propionate CoA-transferase
VKIPGILVDGVVVAAPDNHPQTFAEQYNPAYTGEVSVSSDLLVPLPLDERKVIARRAVMFLKVNSVVNLGIGCRKGSPRWLTPILARGYLTLRWGWVRGLIRGGSPSCCVIPPDSRYPWSQPMGADLAAYRPRCPPVNGAIGTSGSSEQAGMTGM